MEIVGYTRYFFSYVIEEFEVYVYTLEGVAVGLLADKPANFFQAYALDGTVLVNPDFIFNWNFTHQVTEAKVKPYVPPFIPNGLRFIQYCEHIANFNQTKAALIALAKFAAYMENVGYTGGAGYQVDDIRDALIAMRVTQELENNPTP